MSKSSHHVFHYSVDSVWPTLQRNHVLQLHGGCLKEIIRMRGKSPTPFVLNTRKTLPSLLSALCHTVINVRNAVIFSPHDEISKLESLTAAVKIISVASLHSCLESLSQKAVFF